MPFRSRGRSGGRLRIRPSTVRWVGALVMLLSAAAIIAGCGSSNPGVANPSSSQPNTPSMFDTHGPIAAKEAGLAVLIFCVCGVVFVLVTGALLYSIIRFRARPDSPAPRQTAGNTKLEIAWTIVPSVVLFLVLFATIFTMLGLAQPKSANTLTVNVYGHQWWWEFRYPAQNGISQELVTADELVIPANTVVHINLNSDNVIHSFWVPQLGGKTDVIPGHDNAMWLEGDAPGGPYRGECAEFCGTQHAHMDFYVMVDSASDFQNWVQTQQQNATPDMTTADPQLIQQGQQIFSQSACVTCHQINGVNKLPTAVGPNLTHFGSRMIIAGGVLDNNPQNLHTWIKDAQSVKNGVDMPAFDTMSDSDVNALVAYLESLK